MWRLLLLALILQSAAVKAQIDAGVGVGKTQGTLSLAWVHNWYPGKNHKLVIGVGGRFTGYLGRNQYYVTAPAKLTSNATGPLVIFKENITANMDTFLIAKPNVYMINAMINLGYKFNEKFIVGFNIDLVGVSFGGDRRGNHINGPQGRMVNSSVTRFNALLVSDNDLGSLNSELYGRYAINERWAIRGGPQFLFTEYTTDTPVQQNPEPNDRFRKKSLMFMIGTSFNF